MNKIEQVKEFKKRYFITTEHCDEVEIASVSTIDSNNVKIDDFFSKALDIAEQRGRKKALKINKLTKGL